MLGRKPASTPVEVNLNRKSLKLIDNDEYPLVSFGIFSKTCGEVKLLLGLTYLMMCISLVKPCIKYSKEASGKEVLYSKSNKIVS